MAFLQCHFSGYHSSGFAASGHRYRCVLVRASDHTSVRVIDRCSALCDLARSNIANHDICVPVTTFLMRTLDARVLFASVCIFGGLQKAQRA